MSVPLALIRAHLVIDHSDDDQLLTHYGNVAAAWVSGKTGSLVSASTARAMSELPIAGRASMRHCKTARGQFFQIGTLENHPVGASILIGLHAQKGFLDKLVPGGPG